MPKAKAKAKAKRVRWVVRWRLVRLGDEIGYVEPFGRSWLWWLNDPGWGDGGIERTRALARKALLAAVKKGGE